MSSPLYPMENKSVYFCTVSDAQESQKEVTLSLRKLFLNTSSVLREKLRVKLDSALLSNYCILHPELNNRRIASLCIL